MLTVAIASDHAGFRLKEAVKKHLARRGYRVRDFGAKSVASVDYPVFAEKAARFAAARRTPAVLVCGSGIGMSIAANKIRGIRAALVFTAAAARLSRRHNDANVLALSERFTTPERARKIVDAWMATPFEGGRHARRVGQILKMEKGK